MKKSRAFAVLAAVILVAISASGQNLRIVRTGEVSRADGTREYVAAETVIAVDITVRRESVRKGPYARFAQRYFGAIAPLADKDIYEITAASIGWWDNTTAQPGGYTVPLPADATPVVASHTWSATDFVKVQPDRLSATDKSAEEAAREAAQTIFNLRKRRIELITGEYAETVFGEGLRAAIERIDRMENEYLELFYGKQVVTTHTERYIIVPDGGRNAYIVCRFSEGAGLLPDSDLAGQPVLLELRPLGKAQEAYHVVPVKGKQAKQSKERATYAVSDNVLCRVTDGKRELAQRIVPVFQYGVTVDY